MSIFAIFGLLAGVVAVLLALSIVYFEKPARRRKRLLQLGIVTLSATAAYKLLVFFGIFVVPLAALGAAHVELLEGAKTVKSCGKCHVMTPMVTDMHDPASDSLAARHFKNQHIREDQCYACHSGYGFNGGLAAKLEGYRHLVRYTTGIYEEPIKMRGHFDAASCLSCHQETKPFRKISSHQVALSRLSSGEMSCVNCHGPAHPTRSQRTPGSSDYARLMRPGKESGASLRSAEATENVDPTPQLSLSGPVEYRPSAPAEALATGGQEPTPSTETNLTPDPASVPSPSPANAPPTQERKP